MDNIVFEWAVNDVILAVKLNKILDKNSIYLKEEFDYFSEINLFNETCELICQSGYNFEKNEAQHHPVVQTNYKKTGFFEKLFNYLS